MNMSLAMPIPLVTELYTKHRLGRLTLPYGQRIGRVWTRPFFADLALLYVTLTEHRIVRRKIFPEDVIAVFAFGSAVYQASTVAGPSDDVIDVFAFWPDCQALTFASPSDIDFLIICGGQIPKQASSLVRQKEERFCSLQPWQYGFADCLFSAGMHATFIGIDDVKSEEPSMAGMCKNALTNGVLLWGQENTIKLLRTELGYKMNDSLSLRWHCSFWSKTYNARITHESD